MIDLTLNKINRYIPEKWQWILNHDGFRKYFKNTGWMFFGQMFSLLVSFFIGVWVARYLGPENYGIINYVVSFVGLFSFFCYFGVDEILNRELINYPEKRDELLGTAFILKFFGGILALIITIGAVFVFNKDASIRLLSILFSLSFLFQSFYVVNIYFQSQVMARENTKVQLITILISSLLKIFLILCGGGLVWLVIIYALDSLWQGIFLFFSYSHNKLSFFSWHFKLEVARKIWRDGWPLMLSSAIAFIYLRIDQVMIGKIMGNSSVGIYVAGVKITEIFYFIPGIICASLFPAIVNARKINHQAYIKRIKFFYFLLISLALMMVFPIFLFAKPIINILFGAQYVESITVLRIYIWSSFGLFLSLGINQYLMAENKMMIIFWTNLLSMLTNIFLNLILIPVYGLSGAAWSTFISYTLSVFISVIFYKIKKLKNY